jgi:hypothetical protein
MLGLINKDIETLERKVGDLEIRLARYRAGSLTTVVNQIGLSAVSPGYIPYYNGVDYVNSPLSVSGTMVSASGQISVTDLVTINKTAGSSAEANWLLKLSQTYTAATAAGFGTQIQYLLRPGTVDAYPVNAGLLRFEWGDATDRYSKFLAKCNYGPSDSSMEALQFYRSKLSNYDTTAGLEADAYIDWKVPSAGVPILFHETSFSNGMASPYTDVAFSISHFAGSSAIGSVTFDGYASADYTGLQLNGKMVTGSTLSPSLVLAGWKSDGAGGWTDCSAAQKVLEVRNGNTAMLAFLGSGAATFANLATANTGVVYASSTGLLAAKNIAAGYYSKGSATTGLAQGVAYDTGVGVCIGATALLSAQGLFYVASNANDNYGIHSKNLSNGTSAGAMITATNDNNKAFGIYSLSTGNTAVYGGLANNNDVGFLYSNNTAGILIDSTANAPLYLATNNTIRMTIAAGGGVTIAGAFGCNGTVAQTAYVVGGAAAAGGTGATGGAYDTAAHRDALITLVNNIRTALINNGIAVAA